MPRYAAAAVGCRYLGPEIYNACLYCGVRYHVSSLVGH